MPRPLCFTVDFSVCLVNSVELKDLVISKEICLVDFWSRISEAFLSWWIAHYCVVDAPDKDIINVCTEETCLQNLEKNVSLYSSIGTNDCIGTAKK